MAFKEVLLLFIFLWLCWRRLRLARARRRSIAAAQSYELAFVVSQWRLTSHVAIAGALRLLQGNRLERRLWANPRSASFYQDIVPGWDDTDFKRNFCVRRATFAYLVIEWRINNCSASQYAVYLRKELKVRLRHTFVRFHACSALPICLLDVTLEPASS